MKTKQQELIEEENRKAAIQFHLDSDQCFKAYTYRLIDHVSFINRTKELADVLLFSLKKNPATQENGLPSADPNQIDLVDQIELNEES